MHVRWKPLIVLGVILWVLLCLTDVLYDDYGSKKYLSSADDFNWMRDIPEEQLIYTPPKASEHMEITEYDVGGAGFRIGYTFIFWNCVAFLSSIALCSIVRSLSLIILKWYMERIYMVRTTPSPEVLTIAVRSSPSRIPIRRSFSCEERSTSLLDRISDTDFEPTRDRERESCLDLSPSGSLDEYLKINKKEYDVNFAKLLEKQRHLMREEMLSAQAASLKEHAMLSRKLEAVLREKRELSKQLAIAHKENRAAKQQLEELLSEKTCFLKKLETATKQLKANNKTKKLAFVKLEESQAIIANLKLQLEEVMKEKDVLERKIVGLEEEIERFKVEMEIHNIPVGKLTDSEPEKKDSKEHAVDQRNEESMEFFISNEIEEKLDKTSPTISETEIDMQKIQMKIMALEKNLEKFSNRKLLPVTPGDTETTTTSKESTTLNCEDDEKADEETEIEGAEIEDTSNEEKNHRDIVYKEVFVRNPTGGENSAEKTNNTATNRVTIKKADSDNKTRLPRRIIKSPAKDITVPPLYKIPEEITLKKRFPFVGMKPESRGHLSVRSECSSPLLTSPNSFCSTTTSMLDNDTSSEDNNTSSQRAELKKRLVSSSPAFQKFLKALDNPGK